MALVTKAYACFADGDFDGVFRIIQEMPWRQGDKHAPAGRRLLRMLELYDAKNPGQPWPFCLAAAFLARDGQAEAARLSRQICQERCQDDVCRRYLGLPTVRQGPWPPPG
jgi:hypothetical protein